MPHRSPRSVQEQTESLRRRLYLLVAALACAGQLAVIVLDSVQGRAVAWESVFGAALCGALVGLLSLRAVALQWVDFGVLTAASLGVAFELYAAFGQAGPPNVRLYFNGIFLFLAAFSILPPLFAALYSAMLYALLAALTLLKGGDASLLAELALIVLLTVHLSVFGRRVSAERSEAITFQTLALTDALTGLINRRAMYERLERAFRAAESGQGSALLLVDIDHFKNVNDLHGHDVGDQVLQRFAAVLRASVRSHDTVSRWGGEEFLILLPEIGEADVAETARRVLSDVRRADMPAGLRLTASGGLAHASEVSSVAEWLRQVDVRLYFAKHAGRDRVQAEAPPSP
ncbi:hypothetical protein DKM44_02470 [Deinococcus irradiatisoli]|uniref:GGDEF domain-containing protein n=1 Tax=Deinococcus irradiatisoli TaxID=2202254 RepID=A0A2Z3JFU5_9DEIO|nr:GGDEF domain-containing protein [Deinococcus irradiatisoli]AWN22240.1 hypothetical protein DKM44_02470 [Deinococcus irradiatisoli]